jgi:O-antigen/teichoic acid export membrane protein
MAVRKSLALSTLESYFGTAMQLISTVIVARILTPAEMGVFAVAAVFVAVAHMFRDFGIGEYLIQEQELDAERIRAAFTVNIVVSWLMCIVILLGAPFVANFYHTPGIASVLRIQAINFALVPFGAITMAWFRRELDFKPLLLAGVFATVTQFVVTVVLALRGFGYMSLAWASLAATIATVTTSIVLRPKDFPRWPGFTGLGRVFNFGRVAIGIYLFGQIGKGMPELIIGRALSMTAVGVYSRAQGLAELLNRLILKALTPIYLPYFAKAVRANGSAAPEVLRSMSYLTAVGWPFLAFVAIDADAVIHVIYGHQWTDAAPLARILCMVAALEAIYSPAKEALISVGRVHDANSLQLKSQLLRAVGAIVGVPFGIDGVCFGLLIATMSVTAMTYERLKALMTLGIAETLAALSPSLVLTVVASVPIVLTRQLTPAGRLQHLWVVLVGGAFAAVAWLLWMRRTSHELWPEFRKSFDTLLGRTRRLAKSGD